MNKIEHLEDYTNAVIAIVITLMVLDIHAPSGPHIVNFENANNHIYTYVYSFLLISMYWINHRRLFNHYRNIKINSSILWANNIFLLFITFIPFATSWLAEFITYRVPELTYAFIMLCVDLSYYVLMYSLLRVNDFLKREIKFKIYKKKLHLNLIINVLAIIVGYFYPIMTIAISLCAVILWILPDKIFSQKLL